MIPMIPFTKIQKAEIPEKGMSLQQKGTSLEFYGANAFFLGKVNRPSASWVDPSL